MQAWAKLQALSPETPVRLTLLHEDAELVAIDKPAGLLVHRTALDAHEPLNALDLLRAQLGVPLWPAHRLDKGTSGVLLFARSAEAARAIGEAFRTEFGAGRVAKQYLALVRGWPVAEGLVDHPLARDPEQPSTGQPRLQALTRWQVLARHEWPFPDGRHASSRYALVSVWPETGRRHQIRRHFKHLAHPLVGDSTHGKGPHNRAVAAWLGTARLWLHAQRLAVAGRVIEAPPGPEWAALSAAAQGG